MAGDCRSAQRTALRVRVLALVLTLLLPAPALAQTRVACVGDSITYGYGLPNPASDAYPFVLQGLLGSEFEVGNFGDSGSTLQESGDKPWRSQAVHSQCLAFAPNIVVIMLGTNDAKPDNWSEAGFVTDYHALVAEFRDLGAEVYVATPPPVIPPGAFEIQPAVVNDEVVPLVRQVASETNAPLIDVFLAFEDQPDLLPDTVHPNTAGARLIAESVAGALLATDDATSSLQTSATSTTSSTGSGGTTASTSALTATSTEGAGGATDTTGQGGSGPSASATTAGGGAEGTNGETTGLASSMSAAVTGATTAAVTGATSTGDAVGESSGMAPQHSTDEQGCACGVPRAAPSARSAWLLLALLLLVSRRGLPGRARLKRWARG